MDWRTRLDQFPRYPLAQYPSPLERLERLSQNTGCEIYIKRDDELGPGLGGNKTRKLEFLMADAQLKGARRVATFGGLQSNHARLTAAAACRLGLEAHLFYFEHPPASLKGNLQLNQLLGAHMHFLPLGGGGGGMSLETTIRLVRWLARLSIGPHYFIPVGGHNCLGCLGYVCAALEIEEQARGLGIEEACIVVAAGTGGTLAGLMAGFGLCGSRISLLGIDVGKLWKGFPASTAALAHNISVTLGKPLAFDPHSVPLLEGEYVGERYGVPSTGGIEAMRLLARLEGVLLDPVYTAKAFAGMLDQIAQGKLGGDKPVIFWHTGGLPALFAFDLL